jgi:membrane protein implicated in regulation of membrane protease activity
MLLFYVAPTLIPLGALAIWLAFWATSAGILLGCFLMFEMKLKEFMKPLLAGISSLLILNIIFIAPISFDLQLLIVVLFLLTIALLSRHYSPRKPPQPTPSITAQNRSLPKKAAGYTLIIVSALLFLLIIPEALTYSLLVTSLAIVPIIAVGVVGYSLITPYSLKQFIEWLISALIVVLLPFAFILPTEYQILVGILLIIAIALLFYWGYKKIKKEQKEESQTHQTQRVSCPRSKEVVVNVHRARTTTSEETSRSVLLPFQSES